jgi:hypothetical protein
MESVVQHDPHTTGGRVGGGGWSPPPRALVRAEARLVIRHPVTIGSFLLGGAFALMFRLEITTDTSVWYQVLTGMPLVVVGSGMTIVGVLVGSRNRHDRTEDLYDSTPTPDAFCCGVVQPGTNRRREHLAGLNSIDPNTMPGPFNGQFARHLVDPAFGYTVGKITPPQRK